MRARSLLLTAVAAIAIGACGGRRGAPPMVPATDGLITLDAVAALYTRTADPDCPDDARGFWHVDVASKALTFAVCGGDKRVVARTLEDKEIAALVAIVARLPKAAPRPLPAKRHCPRIRWRSAAGELEADGCEREPEGPDKAWNDGAFAIEDIGDLLGGLVRDPRSPDLCGGPLARACAPPGVCGSKNGLVPYAFGSCTFPTGEVTLNCQTIAYCPPGFAEAELTEEECVTKGPCRYVSSGCGDQMLCRRCSPSERCPGGLP